uniref:Serpentine receptor class gamma n=1 Tax=Rhabditophanes sp. KR3021 TaxID=114890 RepID=A0AC35TNQ5_9BILA
MAFFMMGFFQTISIYYLYGIPSIIMLILTLIILIFKNQKELTTSYFRFIVCLLSRVFVELFENLKNTEFDIRFINFFAYYLVYARYLGVLFESTNRLSAITLSFSHEKIWILLLPISVTATIFLPFLGFNITARENNSTILSFGTSLSIAKSNKKDKAERNLLYCTVISLLLGMSIHF